MPQYYIASEDMIGKSGVWGHFGSWSFKRAKIYQTVKNMDYNEAVSGLTEDFDLDESKASDYYYEIQNTEADKWISPWPGYMMTNGRCVVENNTAKCIVNVGQNVQIDVDLSTYEAKIPTNQGFVYPNSFVYVSGDKIKEREYKSNNIGFSVVLVPNGDSYYMIACDPLQANSMFTKLFFFKGHGLKYFDLLDYQMQVTGGEIYTYKVDWDGKSLNKVYDIAPVNETEEEKDKIDFEIEI